MNKDVIMSAHSNNSFLSRAQHQRGASYWAYMSMILMAGMVAKFVIAAGPTYIDDLSINKVIEERLRAVDPEITQERFIQQLSAQFDMNNLRDLDTKNMLTIINDNGLKVHKKYEVRKKFVGNMDIIMTFEKEFDEKQLKQQAK